MSGVYLVGISAIVRAKFNYIDDVGRVAEGYRAWGGFSRFIPDGLSVLIHTDSYITDISPLTQLIAILLVAFSGIILIYVIYERKVYTVWEVLALVSLGLKPYFLQCISYKFDAPFMAVSILAGIMPLLYKERETWEYILAVSIGTIVVCTSYQAASGVFPMCVVLLALRMWMKKMPSRQIFIFCLKSVLGFGIGMIFFRVVIMVPVDIYASNTLPPLAEVIPTVITNYKCYISMMISDFKTVWKWILLLLCVCFAVSGLVLSRQKKILTILVVAISCIGMFLLCFGLYPALEKPIFEPRAMYGFGVFVTILCISVAEYRQRAALRLPAIAITWIFFVFSLTYGNALYIQKTYTDFRITQVITDLNDMEVFIGEKPVVVQIAGSIGQSPVVGTMSKECNILNRLVPVQFRETWIWGQAQFFGYYGLNNVIRDKSQDLTTYGLPVIKDSMYHTIYGNDAYVLIVLKQGSSIYLFENKK
ncbi:MAG: glucosyltransferase domain-containing protein [Lachnospiraceae bacterium]|nr:glucosyltransferase domain-containing protein [Lachnospiraceae bacterium]